MERAAQEARPRRTHSLLAVAASVFCRLSSFPVRSPACLVFSCSWRSPRLLWAALAQPDAEAAHGPCQVHQSASAAQQIAHRTSQLLPARCTRLLPARSAAAMLVLRRIGVNWSFRWTSSSSPHLQRITKVIIHGQGEVYPRPHAFTDTTPSLESPKSPLSSCSNGYISGLAKHRLRSPRATGGVFLAPDEETGNCGSRLTARLPPRLWLLNMLLNCFPCRFLAGSPSGTGGESR